MDIFEAIKNRRSIRRFEDRPVPDDVIETIIEADKFGRSVARSFITK